MYTEIKKVYKIFIMYFCNNFNSIFLIIFISKIFSFRKKITKRV